MSTLMSVIQSGSTSKKLPDLSYVMPSSSSQDASKPTGKSSNSSVDYVAAMSDAKPTSQPPLQGNRRRRGGRGRGQNNSQRSQSPVAHGNNGGKPAPSQPNASQSSQVRSQSPKPSNQTSFGSKAAGFLCGLCGRDHLVVQCPFLRDPDAQRHYQQIIQIATRPPPRSDGKFQAHAHSIRCLSERLESLSTVDTVDDDALNYFCFMSARICKLNHSLHQVMLDNGANAFLFNDASVFSELSTTPQLLKPFKDSATITVDGKGSVLGLGQAYFDRACHNILSQGALEDAGWHVDAVKQGNISVSYTVRSPFAAEDDFLSFVRRDRTYWCHADDFFEYLRKFGPQVTCPTISSVDAEPRYGLRSRSLSPGNRPAMQPARIKRSADSHKSAPTTVAPPRPTSRKVTFNLESVDSDSELEPTSIPSARRRSIKRSKRPVVFPTQPPSDSDDSMPALAQSSDSDSDVPALVLDSSDSDSDSDVAQKTIRNPRPSQDTGELSGGTTHSPHVHSQSVSEPPPIVEPLGGYLYASTTARQRPRLLSFATWQSEAALSELRYHSGPI